MATPEPYFSLLSGRPLSEVWMVFLLTLARIVPTVAIAPFFGGRMISDVIKVGFGVSLTFLFLPFILSQNPTLPSYDPFFYLLMVKEAVVGASLGFLIALPFYFSQGAGALIDHQRGSQSLQVTDPSTQTQTSPTGTLYNNMMLVTFFAIGGPLLFFDGILTSFSLLPVDAFLPPSFFTFHYPFWMTLMGLLTVVVKLSLQLSAPSVLGMLLGDLFLGIANRMAPQVQISFLLWSCKAFVGIALLFASWWLVVKQLDVQATAWLKGFTTLVNTL